MEGAKGVWDRGWELGMGRAGRSDGGKMETIVFEHQLKKSKKKEKV